MASSTSPDGIVFPDASDPIAPLNAVFQDLAESVQTALDGVPSLNVDVTSPSYGQVISYDPASDNFINNADNNPVMVFDDDAARTTAIPTPVEGMVTYLKDTDGVDKFDGSAFVPVASPDGFTAQTTITATNASFSVPALGSPIVKVTVVGGGGGGGASGASGGGGGGSGGDGGTTTFNAGGAGTVTAAGGRGGAGNNNGGNGPATAGLGAGNGGQGSTVTSNAQNSGISGGAGGVTVSYLNLSGVSAVNVTIGGGGSAGTGGNNGVAGGRGEVILEFVEG